MQSDKSDESNSDPNIALIQAHSNEIKVFNEELGRFVLKWADAERDLYRVLCHYAGLKKAVARVLLSGTRAKGMMDFIMAITENTQVTYDRTNDLKFLFSQVAAINTMRDTIIHHGSTAHEFRDPQSRLLKKSHVNRAKNEVMYTIGSKTILSMNGDLHRISLALTQHCFHDFVPWEDSEKPDTWLYKFPSPEKSLASSAHHSLKLPDRMKSSPQK